MTRERMRTLGLVLGVNLAAVALIVATRLWLADNGQPGAANASPTLMLESTTPEMVATSMGNPDQIAVALLEVMDGLGGSVLQGTELESNWPRLGIGMKDSEEVTAAHRRSLVETVRLVVSREAGAESDNELSHPARDSVLKGTAFEDENHPSFSINWKHPPDPPYRPGAVSTYSPAVKVAP